MEILSADLALDEALGAAVEFARDAVVAEVGADRVGEHLEVAMEDERLATHLFECTSLGYRGWRWAVTLARTPDSQDPTVCDVVLLPGPEALVAPPWVPWSERVQPGDLGVGDVFPTAAQDPRLVAGFSGEEGLEGLSSQSPLTPGAWEVGLGRVRVLSPIGRDDAADRWQAGDTGPDSAMAKTAPLPCSTCGFLVPIGGVFGQMFAVCANVMAPADGRIVALDYGCGAHSEVQVDEPNPDEAPAPEAAGDTDLLDADPDTDLLDVGPDTDLGDPAGNDGGDGSGPADPGLDSLLPDDDDEAEAGDGDHPSTESLRAADSDYADADDADGDRADGDLAGVDQVLAGATDAEEPPTGDGAQGASEAPKRPRGRGWLRGRSAQ